MQRNHEAFSGDFRGSPCNSQRNFVHGFCEPEGFPDFKVEMSASSVGAVQSDSSLIRGNLVPHNEGYSGSFHPQKFCTWSNFRPQKVQQNQCDTLMNNFHSGTSEYSSPMEQNIQHSPFRMYAPDYQHAFQFQEFQYFVVIDFEATCDKGRVPHPQEIIEFPSVLVNSITGKLEASFQTYVRPIYHQLLTDFCKELTGIQQIQVDRGVSLSEALLMHDKWLENKGIKHTNFAVVTWSNWDCRVMLESECKFKKIRKPPYFNRWINLKVPFHEVFGGVRCNLKGAVELAGLKWEGRAHCGLDDARNTARLLALLMRRGFRFSITNSLVLPSVDHPLTWQMYADRPSMWCQYLDLPVSPTLHPHNFKHLVGPDPHFHLLSTSPGNDTHAYCFCGVMTCKRMVRKPGPKHGRFFFGCGNWTLTRGAICDYFQWAS